MPDNTSTGGYGGLIGSIVDLIRGMNGQGTNIGNTAAAMSDPFMKEREQYQKQLQGLMTDPSSFVMDPGTKFAMDQGLSGVARFGNAMFGTTRSGNTADTLNRDATGYASAAYNKRIDQLLTLSGATTGSPAAAGQQYVNGNKANDLNLASGLTSIDKLLGLLTSTGGPLAGLGSAAINAIKAALGSGGGSLNADGTINWGSTGTGTGDLGGWPGDTTGEDFTGPFVGPPDPGYDVGPSPPSIDDILGGGGIEGPW